MTTFKHLTYKEWLELYPEVAKEEKPCEECDGHGEIECSECGHIRECEECGGTGKANSSREAYELQVKLDEEKMTKYLASAGVLNAV